MWETQYAGTTTTPNICIRSLEWNGKIPSLNESTTPEKMMLGTLDGTGIVI